jgi:hypothetical protein
MHPATNPETIKHRFFEVGDAGFEPATSAV